MTVKLTILYLEFLLDTTGITFLFYLLKIYIFLKKAGLTITLYTNDVLFECYILSNIFMFST